MKIIITETQSDKMFNLIYDYIDKMYDWDKDYYLWDPEDYEWEPLEIRDSDGFSIMRVYFPEYWSNETPQGLAKIERSPVLDLNVPFSEKLHTMFGPLFKEPLKKWFEDKYGIEVKSVDI